MMMRRLAIRPPSAALMTSRAFITLSHTTTRSHSLRLHLTRRRWTRTTATRVFSTSKGALGSGTGHNNDDDNNVETKEAGDIAHGGSPSLPSFLRTPVGPSGFNRYALIPAAIANHLSLGSIFAWSVFNHPLTTVEGVVAASASDWSLGDTSLTFSLGMFVCVNGWNRG